MRLSQWNSLGGHCLAMVLLTCLTVMAKAEDRDHHGGPRRGAGPTVVLDARYHHDHYYPRPGTPMVALPGGAVHVIHGGGHYYFHGGVWFRPVGPRFVVVAPPFGVVIPFLPSTYVTLSIGGRPYFYANGAYYVTQPGQGYVVVEPPPGADLALPAPTPLPAETVPGPITYPRNGQSAAQNAKDMEECNQWANNQPGVAGGNASVFQRAFAACMDGRGYTVR